MGKAPPPLRPRTPAEIRINNAFALWFGPVDRTRALAPIIHPPGVLPA